MKKFASIFAIAMALVICLGAMTACTGSKDEGTKNPTSSTTGDKNESKPEDDKNESKPEDDKNEGTTESEPEDDKNEGTTESEPEDDKNEGTTESRPEGDTDSEDDSNAEG